MRYFALHLLLWLSFPLTAETITVGLLVTPYQREAYETIFREFTRETGTKIRVIPRSDTDYKEDLPGWLAGNRTPDVLYWQGSNRLFQFVAKGQIHALDDLWKEEKLDEKLSHVKNVVEYEGSVYGIPYSYYHWGLYYNRSLINPIGGPAATWQELLQQCKILKTKHVHCVALGAKHYWPSAGWFDYLNLRLNGLDFHLKLLDGSTTFADPRVLNVLEHLKHLTDNQYFTPEISQLDWNEVLPLVFRAQAGYTLIGNFAVNSIPEQIKSEIGFAPFPKIHFGQEYEEAPVDIFMIPEISKNKGPAKDFMLFISRADTQTRLNKALGYLPPHRDSQAGEDNFLREGFKLLSNTLGVSQYFDRDTNPAFEKQAVKIITEFLEDGDLKKAVDRLDISRRKSFSL